MMNKSIRLAKKQDIPALCDIWKQCFSDSEEYIQCFYKNNFERISVLAYYVNDKPVSMVHLINASFESDIKHQEAKFIYATGTLPQYRKNGYMGTLLEELTKKARDEGFALFLKPSSSELLGYYEKFGFVADSAFQLINISPGKIKLFPCRSLSDNEYNIMREKAFANIPHAKWDNAHIDWCINENELFYGRTLGIKFDNGEYFLLGYPENNTLVINETNLDVEQLKEASAFLCSLFRTKKIAAYMCNITCKEGEKTIPNLIYNSNFNNPYINMIMI